VRSYDPLDVFGLPVPSGLWAVVVHPHCELSTSYSRSVLPREVPLHTATAQMGALASFLAALYTSDFVRLKISLTDFLAEPYRAALIPSFAQVREAALAAGALGCGISGSGPSIFSLCGPDSDPGRIASAMKASFALAFIDADVHVSEINRNGVELR
jgi:homoserine kinase